MTIDDILNVIRSLTLPPVVVRYEDGTASPDCRVLVGLTTPKSGD